MRVLVTGIGGFVGAWLAATLHDAGHDVHGVVHGAVPRPRLARVGVGDDRLHGIDLAADDAAARFAELAGTLAPDAVVHLAALSFVPAAEGDPAAAYRVNVGGTLAVLGGVRARIPAARVLVVSSGDVYGAVPAAELPVGEDAPLRPRTVYGASKAAAEIAAAQWARAYGLHVVVARPFNHTGPGQEPAFVCSGIARQLVLAELGRQDAVVRIGDPDPVRDFSDVRDVAAAYVALLERGRPGVAYNVCRGDGASVAEVLAILRTQARIAVRVRSDPALRRANDVPRLVGTHARATADTGWTPRIPLAETLGALLVDWRARLADA